MAWQIIFTSRSAKQASKLPLKEQDILLRLTRDLQISGPVQKGWRNYSPLGKEEHHCHLSYKWIACWRVKASPDEVIEIYYAGSRENAPY